MTYRKLHTWIGEGEHDGYHVEEAPDGSVRLYETDVSTGFNPCEAKLIESFCTVEEAFIHAACLIRNDGGCP